MIDRCWYLSDCSFDGALDEVNGMEMGQVVEVAKESRDVSGPTERSKQSSVLSRLRNEEWALR
jgi:hypothetical protein